MMSLWDNRNGRNGLMQIFFIRHVCIFTNNTLTYCVAIVGVCWPRRVCKSSNPGEHPDLEPGCVTSCVLEKLLNFSVPRFSHL